MKQFSFFLAAAICALSLAACGPAAADSSASASPDASASVPESVSSDSDTELESELEYHSALGYSLLYNVAAFKLDDSAEDYDLFTLNAEYDPVSPVYVAVQKFTDMDAKTVIDGVVLQSGLDNVEAYESTFGYDSINTWATNYEKEENGVTSFHVFNAVPLEEGCLLVEVSEYKGMSDLFAEQHEYFLTSCLELMLNSFVLE